MRAAEIERQAEALWAAFEHQLRRPVRPPLPVEDLLEKHLGLILDFDTLADREPGQTILGSLVVASKQVVIDEQLDPTVNPIKIGRFRFTVAHEIAHWSLHKDLIADSVCVRGSRIEWEADQFASSLLMPRQMVIKVWEQAGGNPSVPLRPIVDRDFKRPRRRGMVHISTVVRDLCEPKHRYIFDQIAKELAPIFEVSVQAMRIRLKRLGLLDGSNSFSE